MSNQKLFVVLILLITHSLPTLAARELVDDFNGSTIDFTKWSGFDHADDISEQLIRIEDGKLVLMNASDGAEDHSTITSLTNTHFSFLRAEISVISAESGGSAATASIEGQYYNASSAAATDQVGDVAAMVFVGDRGSGGLEAWWEIRVSTHPEFEDWTETTGVITLPGTLLFGNPYAAEIQYNVVNGEFTFIVDGTNRTASGPQKIGEAAFPHQNLAASTRCCGVNPSIHATFDDVTGSGGLLDDFSSDLLDRSKWANHSGAQVLSSRVDPAVTGKLFMFVSDENILPDGKSSTDLVLRERNPNRIEAEVSISSDSVLDPGLRGRARLNGYAYNESRDGGIDAFPYNGCDGDVYVQVEINLRNDSLYATAFAGSETAACETDETLVSEIFTQLLEFDTPYLIWIERDDEDLILGLGDEEYRHTITTPTYPPSPSAYNGFRRLSARIQGTSTSFIGGADGVFEMLVDNVYVNDLNESSGGGSSSCFIATAAYGSYLDPHVKTLRRFRDQYLLTNVPGEWFVRIYYQHSPPIADYIRERETLKTIVRSVLTVAVYSIEYPVLAGLVLLLPPLMVIRQRKRRKNQIL